MHKILVRVMLHDSCISLSRSRKLTIRFIIPIGSGAWIPAFNQPENDGFGPSLFLARGESPNASCIIGVNLIQISSKIF